MSDLYPEMHERLLAEQQSEYLVQQMQMYASGQRRNDVYARMRTIAAKLTPAEIAGLAAYYRARGSGDPLSCRTYRRRLR